MRKNFFKRTLAGVLSAVTLFSSMAVSVPTAFAAEEDNKASAIEIKVVGRYGNPRILRRSRQGQSRYRRQAVHRNRAGQGYACVRRCCQVGQP